MLVPNGVHYRGVPLYMRSEYAYMLTERRQFNIATENADTIGMHTVLCMKRLPLASTFCNHV